MKIRSLYILIGLLLLSVAAGCIQRNRQIEKPVHDLEQIQDSGVLRVLTLYSSTSYFQYRGQEMGFQYELAEQFAAYLGVKLEVVVARNVQELTTLLLAGKGDLIAYNLPVTNELRDSIEYCGEETITHQVLVQRNKWRSAPLKDVTELIGKEVYVKPGRYLMRMNNLNEEVGGGIIIHNESSDSLSLEDLIMMVAQGKIDYTVADNDVAKLNQTYYPNLEVSMAVSHDQRASWAVRKECTQLAEAVNKWHEENTTSPKYTASMKRYFELSKTKYFYPIMSVSEGKISPYDNLFRQYAKEINWDWRLLASLAYTESNFDTTAVSWAGAKGLMQLMPRTAKAMGVPEGKEQNPEESIKGAVKYIELTASTFKSIPQPERNKFILAAYNSGTGHIIDAMALAEKYGANKYVWDDNVEKYILLKSHEEYFSDPVCKHGYFRGIETYNFVRETTQRYYKYREVIKE
ncbi:MAG: transporter substrate-binding domain-containing protein [Bacteroidaceae bacterium]|nr:transporter substrate-binding domain-containing protein [Bacteroidaceae bacterium]